MNKNREESFEFCKQQIFWHLSMLTLLLSFGSNVLCRLAWLHWKGNKSIRSYVEQSMQAKCTTKSAWSKWNDADIRCADAMCWKCGGFTNHFLFLINDFSIKTFLFSIFHGIVCCNNSGFDSGNCMLVTQWEFVEQCKGKLIFFIATSENNRKIVDYKLRGKRRRRMPFENEHFRIPMQSTTWFPSRKWKSSKCIWNQRSVGRTLQFLR